MRWFSERVLLANRRLLTPRSFRHRITSVSTSVPEVPRLLSWDIEQFQERAFFPAKPYRLPVQANQILPASQQWFIHDSNPSFDLKESLPESSELRTSFWSQHENALVPLELTSTSDASAGLFSTTSFHRGEAPLRMLLTYLGNALSPASSSLQGEHSIYLAQCSLRSLPETLQADVPTPPLVLKSGKGDIYDSSLWLGRPPTYTPLHRDPNPNLFLQLAGKKVVRLFPPEIGDAIFEEVQEQLCGGPKNTDAVSSSAAFRGEEMMAGPERNLLHQAVWEDDEALSVLTRKYVRQAEIGIGEALFIPKGWWHSVKGVGRGITASANWWFR
jgi:Cupin-like domain